MLEPDDPEEWAGEIFDEIDANGSGEIEVYQFIELLVSLPACTMKDEEIHHVVMEFDKSGDGSIDKEEFIETVKEMRESL